jgi:single-stranded DNA-binding protein
MSEKKVYVRPAAITIEGRLTRDAEVKVIEVGDGRKLMKFAVAVDGPQKVNAEGSQTSFFECESWNEKQINLFSASLKKGTEVQITGRPWVHTYTHKEYPVKMSVAKITVESIKLLARPVRSEAAANA